MQTITTILNRRSIRKYITKPVEPEKTDQLLEAAMYAPSARNYRPWHFIVVDERKKLNDLSELHPYAKMLKEAPLAIVVCGDKSIEKEDGYLAISCSAATQNILLSAFDMGLGSVWLGLYPREPHMKDLQEYFILPDYILPISLVAIGYPAEEKERPERFEKGKVHWNRW